MYTKKEFSIDVGGKKLTAAFSDLAENANGSVILSYGNTTVLATAVMSDNERQGLDYFPLTVDYEEKFYAAGAIMGSRFVRREGRPSDEAILVGRVVDRTIRPLFDKAIRNDVQIIITVLSIGEDDPDVLAVNAASLALATSDIPWNGPVSAVRIGKRNGTQEFLINPASPHRDAESILDSMVCGKDGRIVMIETAAKEIPEDDMVSAFEEASREIEKMQEFQKKIIKELGKEKRKVTHKQLSEELKQSFRDYIEPKFEDTVFSPSSYNISDLKKEWMLLVKGQHPEETDSAAEYFENRIDELIHVEALEHNRRADGRDMNELRQLFAQAGGVSPVLHGSGIFYRGGTHILSVLTLGAPRDAQIVEGMEIQTTKRFMHHYNFPPFSAGETGRVGGMNRRMIGHGALAEKALLPVIPPKEVFPYTIRIVSETMASNGSTSQASICASTLALMDAGVPIKAPVAGIAMGLMYESDKKYKVLTDIQGPEDHHGDMDFKVAGTKDGVTAIQMDIKLESVPIFILKEALEQAKKTRLKILETIAKAIPAPRPDISPSAPKILITKILVDKIGALIGPGGKMINKIIDETGAEIDIEEDGTVFVTGKNGAAEAALKKVEEVTHEFTPGERFEGEVTRIFDFGAMVKLGSYDGEGLVHVSELAPVRIERPSDIVKLGDIVPVVVKEIDEKGRVNLSIKSANPDFFRGKVPEVGVARDHHSRNEHDRNRGSFNRNR